MPHVQSPVSDRELKKGSAELLILSLVEARPRHGYEISKLIEQRSAGALRFHVASLYPLLYRLERRGWILGRWVEKAGQRRRRYYRLTLQGRGVLASQMRGWQTFVQAVNAITAGRETEHA
jgi:PadR family transcriptional regulator PadR